MPESKGLADATVLRHMLLGQAQQRVAVLGPPCIGKSTILQHIPEALDMDVVLFPTLSPTERRTVFRKPWSPSVGKEMQQIAWARIVVQPGHPVFATVVIDVDFIIHLKTDDDLLERRIMLRQERRQSIDDVKGIQMQLESEIARSGIPYTEFFLLKENQDC